ncbi:hypothetical protein POF51_25895 [Brevibacillus sp. AG]|uniref:hypothetical protein n=1 Tax=Brevibacillus sp. AG TaxID=3020891 RepID=UPI00232CF486|nr:hypothetical protein [Brevibacillus sp. AG]MDC0764156.1 hypothetical protein [Brevibacillus sp. AG]
MKTKMLADQDQRENSLWNNGDHCKLKGTSGHFVILNISPGRFPTTYIARIDSKGQQSKRRFTGILLDQLLRIDEEEPSVDKEGRTAYEAALALAKSGYVMTDFYHTTSEMLAKVIQISPSGRIKVTELFLEEGLLPKFQGRGKDKVVDMEVQIIDYSNLKYKESSEPKIFTPKLHFDEWRFWHKKTKVLRHPKMTKENLLD